MGTGLLEACAAPPPAAPAGAAPTGAPTAPQSAAKAAAPTRPEPKGKVTIVVGEEPATLASHETSMLSGLTVLRNIQEALINRDPKTNELVGELATKWELTKPTVWRFQLRSGVKFHDGSPFNAETAAFGINYVWGKENKSTMREWMGPEFVARAVDELTLEVETESPDPILPSRLYFSGLPSMKQIKEKPQEYLTKPVGTGPYRIVEWVKGQQIRLEANPDWWGHTASNAGGAVTIKEMVFVGPRAEGEVRSGMVRAGEADIARWVSKSQCETTAKCERVPSVETAYVRLDMVHHAMKDRRVREAIALAIDKKAIMEGILDGGIVAGQLVGPSALGYDPDLKPYPYDPAKAKSLIAAAKADGVPVDLPLNVLTRKGVIAGLEEANEAIGNMLTEVGLNVKIQALEKVAYNEMLRAPKPISPDRGMVGLLPHGNELMDYSRTVGAFFASDGAISTAPNPKVDEMYKKALALGGAERVKAFQEINRYAYEQISVVPIGHLVVSYGLSKRLNWKPRLDGFILAKEMTLTE